MQSLRAVLCIAALLAPASASVTNPLAKTIELLESLKAKIVKEGEAEEVAYKEFVEWCDDAAVNTRFEIKTALAKKEKLEATISKSISDADAASGKIEDLAASISTDEADLKSATGIRVKEQQDFAAGEKELVDSIDTLGRAVSVIEREMAKNPAAFAQVDTTSFDKMVKSVGAIVDAAAFLGDDKKKLMALVQNQQSADADDEEMGAPAAAAYKSHSSNIVEVLEDLKEKAEEQLGNLRKAETNTKHNYEMLKQSLVDQTNADNKDLNEEKSGKAAAEETKATATGDLTATVKDLAGAKKALEMANSNCMQTAADHESTVAARTEELKALANAKQILQETTGGAQSQSYSFYQVNTASSLHSRTDLANAEVVNVLKRLAKEQHSSALQQLASRVSAVIKFGSSAGEDPFAKVRGLISDMIARLSKEADGDATEKAYCDEQMSKTGSKKDELNGEISKLSAKIDQAATKSAGLKESVKETQADLAKLAKSQAEMDKIRRTENSDYTTAKADLELGLEGVRKALGVLREYYQGGGAAAMLQGGEGIKDAMEQPAMPEQHAASSGAGNSIIGVLEVVESDFAKDLAQEETAEADSSSEYEKMTQENAISKTMKEQDVKYNTQEFKGLDKTVAELNGDRGTSDTELSAVMEYYGKIKERCIAKPETYEDRKGRREAEIDGLKEALRILEDETAFTQRSKKGRGFSFLGLHKQ